MRKASAFFCVVSLVSVSNIGAYADDTLFYGCLNSTTKKVGKVAAAAPNCSSHEILVWWNQIGPQGLPGQQGPKGDKGDIGSQGVKGEKGETGQKGDRGNIGPEGSMGPQGIPGQQGMKGDKGDKGDTGPEGLQGEPAPRGAGNIAFMSNYPSGYVLLKDGTVYTTSDNIWYRTPAGDPPIPLSRIIDWQIFYFLDSDGNIWYNNPRGDINDHGTPPNWTNLGTPVP